MIDESWDKVWKDFSGLNSFGKLMIKSKERQFRKFLPIFMPKNSSIIDIGTGSGHVLKILRDIGYKDSIGIDPSENALEVCKRKGFIIGKDVFKGDSSSWKRKYDVVWSDGLLEHFDYADTKGIAKDFVRMSKRFIGFVQPNPYSLILKATGLLGKSGWEKERPYPKEFYIRLFESLGYHLIHFSYINFKEDYLFIFEKDEVKKK